MSIRTFIEEFVEDAEPIVLVFGKIRKKTTKKSILSNNSLSDKLCKIGTYSGMLAIYVSL